MSHFSLMSPQISVQSWPLSCVLQRSFIDLLHHNRNDSLTRALYQSLSFCSQLDCLLVVRCMESMCESSGLEHVAWINVILRLSKPHSPAIALILKNMLSGYSLDKQMLICVHLYSILSMNKVKFNLLYCMLEYFGDVH